MSGYQWFGGPTVTPDMADGVRENPDAKARQRELAKRYGLPEGVVREYEPDYQAQAKLDETRAAMERSPAVYRWFDSDPSRTAIAHDDLGSLTEIANTIRQGYNPPPEAGGFLSSLGGAARSGLMSGAGGIYGIGRAVAEAATVLDVVLPGDPLAATAEFFAAQSERFQRQGAADMPRGDGPLERGLYGGIASTVRTAPGMLAMFLPGGQGAALGMMTAPVGGESFQAAREQGLSVPRAAAYGITQAGIEYLTEKIPVSRLFGDLAAGSGFMRTLGRQLTAEIPGEQAATILQDLSEWATLNPDRPFADYLAERPEAAVETLVATLVGTSIQTGTLSAVDQVVARYQDRSQRATLTEQQSAMLDRMTQLAQASKVAERDPESFEALVELAAEDGPVEHVYISAEAFFQSGLDRVSGLSEAVLTQLPAASASGGLVQIPVAEWTTRIARTEQGAAALDNVKFDPEGFTRSEAVAYLETEGEQLAADVARAMEAEQTNETFQASRDRVRDAVLEELNTAGRFRPEKNAVDAELIAARTATRAAQLGVTPEELWQRQGFRVRADLPDGGVRLDQAATSIDQNATLADQDWRVQRQFGMRLFRATSESETGVPRLTSWTPDYETAEAYTDNPGFGGPHIRDVFVSIDEPEILDVDQFGGADLAALLGYDDPAETAQQWVDNGWRYPWEESGEVKRRLLETEYAAIRYEDDFPDGATTVVMLRDASGVDSNTPGDQLAGIIGEPINQVLEQAAPVGPRGAYIPDANTIALLENANLSTFLHESAHYFFESDIALANDIIARGGPQTQGEQQIVDDVAALLRWHGIQGTPREQLDQWALADFEERRAYHERTAESFERYLFEGRAPSVELAGAFARFRAWLLQVYRSIKRLLEERPDAGALSDEVRGVFDRMLATEEQIAVAEQARSLMPLFATADQAGMDPEAFAAYHEVARDATTAAARELESKGLRDMRWLHRARGREIARLKREAKAARGEVEMEVRREIMAQPVYRAWRFLTAKITEEDALPTARGPASSADVDPSVDSMFAAIAKLGGLNKDKTVSEFGVDPKSRPQSGVFGKPVWRLGDDGHSPDAMAHMLADLGYLYEGEDGRPGLHEFEARFDRELSGDVQRSLSYDYARDMDVVPGSQMHNRATIAAGRLDIDALSEMDVPNDAVEVLRKRRMTKRDAIHPDIVAELTGFDSGEQMVLALAAAEDPRTVIADTVDQRMIEQYGELATPQAIERAADAAVHNAVRARMVETELGALDRAMRARQPAAADRRGRPRSVNVLPAAAREMARNMIARLRVRDVRPGQYAAAQAKAAEAAGRAMGAGDLAQAAAEKRNQLLNLYATRAAYDAQDEVARGVAYLKKFTREGTRKNVARDYLDQIDALLEQFDLRSRSLKAIDRDTSLAEWVKSQQDQGFEPTVDAARLAQIGQTHYRNLTVEDFRGLVESVQNIEHLGRLKQTLLKAKDQRELDVILSEVAQSIRDNGGKAKSIPSDEQAERAPWMQGFLAGHRKFSSLIRQMDGGKDGGPLWRALGRSMNDAGASEASMVEGATQDLAELYAPILRMKGGTTGAKMVIPEIGETLTRGARLAVALNWGNEQNRQRLLDGRGWTTQQAEAVLDKLTAVEWDFVQGVWDYLETWWPQIAAKERRVTGQAPEKVPAAPFEVTLPNGQTRALRGGYYPAKYDPRQDIKTEQQATEQLAADIKRGAYTRSTTRRGHTKQRAENVSRPIRLSLDVITEHVAQVTHDLAWHEWLIDAGRILGSQRVQSAIREHYGPAVARTMRGHLDAIAVGNLQAQTAIDQMLLYLRASVSRSTMGISLTTALLQPFGLTQSMVRIGPQWVIRGLARWAGDTADGVARRGRFFEATQWIYDRSEFMRLRAQTFNRELHEIRGRVTKGRSRARQAFDATMFMLMQKMQLVADVPTWFGAYEKATAAGLDEEAAIAQADQAVLDSQGGGQTKDLAEFQKRHPMLTMFYSYFSTTYNLAAESSARVDLRRPLTIAGWVSDMMLLMVIPALAPALLLHWLQGGTDDEKDPEEWATMVAQWQTAYLLGLVLGAREFSGSVSGFDYAGPPVGRVVTELTRLGKQAGQGELDEALAFSAVRFFGAATGVPTTQAIRSYKGWQAWEEGDAGPTSILFGPPPPP